MIPVIKRAKEGSNFPEARGLCFFPDVMRLPYDLNNRLRRTDNLPQEKKKKSGNYSLHRLRIGQFFSKNNARKNDYIFDPLMNSEQFQILKEHTGYIL